MPKIVFFNITHFSVGRGGEIWEKEVIEYLNSHTKFKAKLITTDCCKINNIKVDFDYKVIKLKKLFGLNLYNIKDILDEIKDADIVYYFYNFIGSQLPIITYRNYIKNLIVGHHAKIDWNIVQRIYYNLIDRKFKNIGYHHVLTNYYKSILEKKGFKNVFVIPNFVDTSLFKPSPNKEDLIIAPGAVSPQKGYDVIVYLARKLPNIEIKITGRRRKDTETPPNIEFLDYLDRKQYVDLLSRSKICIIPTKGEMFPLTLLECLSSGNLILMSNLPELVEISGNIESVVFAGSKEEFYYKIQNLIQITKNNESLFQKLSQESVNRAKNFDKFTVLTLFEKFLYTVLHNGDDKLNF